MEKLILIRLNNFNSRKIIILVVVVTVTRQREFTLVLVQDGVRRFEWRVLLDHFWFLNCFLLLDLGHATELSYLGLVFAPFLRLLEATLGRLL